VGWAIIVGHTKKQFQIANLVEVNSKPEFFKNKHFTNCNVSKCHKILKEKQISLFFSMFLESLCSFKQIKLNLCVFPIPYTCLHVISYKCKYVLFQLNMLRLFQKIKVFFFEIKQVSNKNFFLKYPFFKI
jgi:hypothetical protein